MCSHDLITIFKFLNGFQVEEIIFFYCFLKRLILEKIKIMGRKICANCEDYCGMIKICFLSIKPPNKECAEPSLNIRFSLEKESETHLP